MSLTSEHTWHAMATTIGLLLAVPMLQIGIVYKQMWYHNLGNVPHSSNPTNCTCNCYDSYIEGRAYYSMGKPYFYSASYRHIYINTGPQSALLLGLMACSILLLHRLVESLWRMSAFQKFTMTALALNVLLAYDLFWSTFQSANAGRVAAAIHSGVFYSMQCCLCWSLLPLTDRPRQLTPLALNWATVLTCGPLLVQSANILTLLQHVSHQIVLRDHLGILVQVLGHIFTLAALWWRPAAEWKLVFTSQRLLCLDATCVALLWVFNILT